MDYHIFELTLILLLGPLHLLILCSNGIPCINVNRIILLIFIIIITLITLINLPSILHSEYWPLLLLLIWLLRGCLACYLLLLPIMKGILFFFISFILEAMGWGTGFMLEVGFVGCWGGGLSRMVGVGWLLLWFYMVIFFFFLFLNSRIRRSYISEKCLILFLLLIIVWLTSTAVSIIILSMPTGPLSLNLSIVTWLFPWEPTMGLLTFKLMMMLILRRMGWRCLESRVLIEGYVSSLHGVEVRLVRTGATQVWRGLLTVVVGHLLVLHVVILSIQVQKVILVHEQTPVATVVVMAPRQVMLLLVLDECFMLIVLHSLLEFIFPVFLEFL